MKITDEHREIAESLVTDVKELLSNEWGPNKGIDNSVHIITKALAQMEAKTIQRCAEVVEIYDWGRGEDFDEIAQGIAKAIRSLKDA